MNELRNGENGEQVENKAPRPSNEERVRNGLELKGLAKRGRREKQGTTAATGGK
jgi:hypothetical protein